MKDHFVVTFVKQGSLITKGNLKKHNMIHTGERPHVCELCGKGFIEACSLRDHKPFHTGETAFLCSYCGKTFTQRKNYQKHLRKHIAGSHRCSSCGEIFQLQTDYIKHLEMHLSKNELSEENLPYHHCKICFRKYLTTQSLNYHMPLNIERSDLPATIVIKNLDSNQV